MEGIPGLRPHLARRGLELVWPGSGARIVIPRVTRARWASIEAMLLLNPALHDIDASTPIWPAHPDTWTPAEVEGFTGWQAYPQGQRGFPDYTWIESGMLRRAGLLRAAGANFLEAAYPDGNYIWPAPPEGMLSRGDLLPVRTDTRRRPTDEWFGLPIDHGDGYGDITAWAISKPNSDRPATPQSPWQPPISR